MAFSDLKHRGTLVCVVLKARNLPNKRSIGKQDPYCVLGMDAETQKTKPDKRGGQHPVWDEQLHFEIYEDMEDEVYKRIDGTTSLPSNDKSKGGKKILKVACYADDNREPEFIGEGLVDLTETLRTGEFDEWVTIKAKDRYAGEVYLELTFYSSAAPPKRKKVAKPVVSGTDTYGGAGTFQDISDIADVAAPPPPRKSSTQSDLPAIPASMRPGNHGSISSHGHRHSMSSSMSVNNLSSYSTDSTTSNEFSSGGLRPSTSMIQIDAYTPPYAPLNISRAASPAPPPPPPPSSLRVGAPQDSPTLRRHSFVNNHRPEASSITPSTSFVHHAPAVPTHSYQYDAAANTTVSSRYGGPSPASYSYNLPPSSSMPYIPAHSPASDPTEQLVHSMSTVNFGNQYDNLFPPTSSAPPPPPPPPSSHQAETPPQSHIYQHPSQIQTMPYRNPALQSSYQSYAHQSPSSSTLMPAQADYQQAHTMVAPPQQQQQQQQQQQLQDSLPPRPSSSMSAYSSVPVSAASSQQSTASVINAQAYYQNNSNLQPQSQPSLRPASPAASVVSLPTPAQYHILPIVSPYAPQPPPQTDICGVPPQPTRTPRPLPSTQSMSNVTSTPPAASQAYYAPSPSSSIAPPQSWSQQSSTVQSWNPSASSLPSSTSLNYLYSQPQSGQPSYAASQPPPQQQQQVTPSASQIIPQGWQSHRSPSPLPPIPTQQPPPPQSQPYLANPTGYPNYSPSPQQHQSYHHHHHQLPQPPPPHAPAGSLPHTPSYHSHLASQYTHVHAPQ